MTEDIIKEIIEYDMIERNGEFYITVSVDRAIRDSVGPFESKNECERAYEDLLQMMRSQGAIDIPERLQ